MLARRGRLTRHAGAMDNPGRDSHAVDHNSRVASFATPSLRAPAVVLDGELASSVDTDGSNPILRGAIFSPAQHKVGIARPALGEHGAPSLGDLDVWRFHNLQHPARGTSGGDR
jgi:hypothetical protein